MKLLLLLAALALSTFSRAQDSGGPIDAAGDGEAEAAAPEESSGSEADTYTEEEMSGDQTAAPVPVESGAAPLGGSSPAPVAPAAARAPGGEKPRTAAKSAKRKRPVAVAVASSGPALPAAVNKRKADEQPAVPLTPIAPSNP